MLKLSSNYLVLCLCVFIFVWGPHPVVLKDYSSLYTQELTPGNAQVTIWGMFGTEPGMAKCKLRALSAGLLFWPHTLSVVLMFLEN